MEQRVSVFAFTTTCVVACFSFNSRNVAKCDEIKIFQFFFLFLKIFQGNIKISMYDDFNFYIRVIRLTLKLFLGVNVFRITFYYITF
jgi:hypothetical protein